MLLIGKRIGQIAKAHPYVGLHARLSTSNASPAANLFDGKDLDFANRAVSLLLDQRLP